MDSLVAARHRPQTFWRHQKAPLKIAAKRLTQVSHFWVNLYPLHVFVVLDILWKVKDFLLSKWLAGNIIASHHILLYLHIFKPIWPRQWKQNWKLRGHILLIHELPLALIEVMHWHGEETPSQRAGDHLSLTQQLVEIFLMRNMNLLSS